MAVLSLLLPVWEAPLAPDGAPDLLVAGARPACGAGWVLVVGVLPGVLAGRTAVVLSLIHI